MTFAPLAIGNGEAIAATGSLPSTEACAATNAAPSDESCV